MVWESDVKKFCVRGSMWKNCVRGSKFQWTLSIICCSILFFFIQCEIFTYHWNINDTRVIK